MSTNFVRLFQNQLVAIAREKYARTPISQTTIDAFYSIPRHRFVSRYRHWESDQWMEVTEQNLDRHLSALYSDNALPIFGTQSDFESSNSAVSTISQPSFVLRMLDLLQIKKGQKVFELGAGSGWNSGLLGHLVGSTGKVVSLEIIPELVRSAHENLQRMGLAQVEVKKGDGGYGDKTNAPYDRAIFTAGCYDLPRSFHHQIREGGLLLFVLKNRLGSDTLLVLRKEEKFFESTYSMACEFVPMTGHYKAVESSILPLSADTMASPPSFRLRIYSNDTPIDHAPTHPIARQQDSTFCWEAND